MGITSSRQESTWGTPRSLLPKETVVLKILPWIMPVVTTCSLTHCCHYRHRSGNLHEAGTRHPASIHKAPRKIERSFATAVTTRITTTPEWRQHLRKRWIEKREPSGWLCMKLRKQLLVSKLSLAGPQGSRMALKRPGGEHHQHQLALCWPIQRQEGSIMSISWPFALEGARRGASSASAGPLLADQKAGGGHHQHQLASSASAGPLLLKGPGGEHHQHQLALCWPIKRQEGGIISISWPFAPQAARRGASSASAGPLLALKRPGGEHHQQQLALCWPIKRQEGSIISISWPFAPQGARRGASSASAGPLLALKRPGGEHHQHQLALCWPIKRQEGSFISISWPFAPQRARRGASSASAGPLLALKRPGGEHHQHQLALCWPIKRQEGSIISISWPFAPQGARRGASSASAGPLLALKRPGGEHHQHQLALCWPIKRQERSIISISWPGGEHHQHQLALCSSRGQEGSIISISWPFAGQQAARRGASSASAGPLLADQKAG